jgi:peptide deformylase
MEGTARQFLDTPCFTMALLPILKYPDPRLHLKARPVEKVDDRIRRLVADMFETMYADNGVGLAATQVNVQERVIVIDISEDASKKLVLINPEILDRSTETKEWEEGCLSVPGIYEKVVRPERVRVRALNEQGERYEFDADELLAVAVQHEIDHLDGKVFVQYLSELKRNRIRAKMLKLKADK